MAVTNMSSYFNIFQIFNSILILIMHVYMVFGDVTHSATYKRMDTAKQSVYGTRLAYFSDVTFEVKLL